MSRPYVVKLGDTWTYGCPACGLRRHGLTWRQAVERALWHTTNPKDAL